MALSSVLTNQPTYKLVLAACGAESAVFQALGFGCTILSNIMVCTRIMFAAISLAFISHVAVFCSVILFWLSKRTFRLRSVIFFLSFCAPMLMFMSLIPPCLSWAMGVYENARSSLTPAIFGFYFEAGTSLLAGTGFMFYAIVLVFQICVAGVIYNLIELDMCHDSLNDPEYSSLPEDYSKYLRS